MPERIPLGATIRVPLQAYLASDHISPATGKTLAITISKNGAAYGNPSAGATNATEIASGSYYVDLSATDTGTLGPLFVRGAVATVDDVIAIYHVVAATNGGFTALPAAAADAAGGLIISDLGGLDADAQRADVAAILVDTGTTLDARIPAALVGGRMDASVGAMAANVLTASALAADAGAEIADAILDRNMATGTDSGSPTVRTPRQALRALRNKWTNAAGTYTVTKEDDTTTSWTAALTTDAAAVPIITSDPASA
jgi:hypothetical protein